MENKNFERYNLIHEELMKRLEAGEITTEQAREMNNRFFDKYITEGAGTIAMIVLASPWLLAVGAISVLSIVANISDKVDYKKKKKTLNTVQSYTTNLTKLANDLHKAKEIQYKPEVINIMKENLSFIKKVNDKLQSLDKKLFTCSSIENYKKIESSLIKEYKKLYEEVKSENKKQLEKVDKLAESGSEYVNDKDIINILKEYLTFEPHYRNMAGDDFWEQIKFIVDAYDSHEQDQEDAINDIYEDIWNCLASYPHSMVTDEYKMNNILKYIKIRFK